MKKKMILTALLAIPLGTLLADQYSMVPTNKKSYDQQVVEETMGTESENPMYTQPFDMRTESENPMYTQQFDMSKQNVEKNIGDETYESTMKETIGNQVSYDQEIVTESIGDITTTRKSQNPSMYEQQVVEESIEVGSPGMTPEQRAAHAELMTEVKQTGAKKPSEIAKKKKTAAKKTTVAKKAAPVKTAPVKKSATKTTMPKKATSNGKKTALTKTTKSGKAVRQPRTTKAEKENTTKVNV